MKIMIGILIGIIISKIYVLLKQYLKKNHLKLDWKNIVIVLIIGYLIYSFVGILIAPTYKKPNGNECKGFNYGIHICNGDINAE